MSAAVARPRLLVLGGGNMGGALVRGLLASGWPAASLVVAEADAGRRHALGGLVPGVRVVGEPVEADGAVVAVKPQSAAAACGALAALALPRWLSIMAGVPLARLEGWAGSGTAVVRAMPNTPALVGAGVTAVAAGAGAGEAELAWAEEVLGSVGEVVRVAEGDLDAVTAVSGSGPAYVFLLAEAMADAGASAGLDPALALRLARATVAGAGRLLAEPGAEPGALRAQVTSPGGTTEAAVGAFEAGGLRQLVARAVAAAADRSRSLANEGR